jgi:hypothetical protein
MFTPSQGMKPDGMVSALRAQYALSPDGRISIFVQPKRCVPKGHFENSPAFERRGLPVSQQVPQGRLKKHFFSAVPAGLGISPTCPGIEMPGYFRWFLRNRKAA